MPIASEDSPDERLVSTLHRVVLGDARRMADIDDESIDLVVTSPPYPMIEMWDALFGELSPNAGRLLAAGDGPAAFEAMHVELDRVWAECRRVLGPGGFLCVNVGDAVRTIAAHFRLYSNHARIIQSAVALGFTVLPDILWRKPTNAPSKFMGSGMLPAGAYVTYEHEYILVFRKGGKRPFDSAREKSRRRRSAFFWEERNEWFSDVWMSLVGTRQAFADAETRSRSAAFPFELPFRLIQMFSLIGDTVLDPFAGSGTTSVAALTSGRSSVAIEKDPDFAAAVERGLLASPPLERMYARSSEHEKFVAARRAAGKPLKHQNVHDGRPVMTSQEKDLEFRIPVATHRLSPGLIRADLAPLRPSAARPQAPRTSEDDWDDAPLFSSSKEGSESADQANFGSDD